VIQHELAIAPLGAPGKTEDRRTVLRDWRGGSPLASGARRNRLEANGPVERRSCKEDGRGHLVAITEAGRDLRRRIWPVYAAAINDAVGAQLSEDEAAKLAGLLRQISAHHEA